MSNFLSKVAAGFGIIRRSTDVEERLTEYVVGRATNAYRPSLDFVLRWRSAGLEECDESSLSKCRINGC